MDEIARLPHRPGNDLQGILGLKLVLGARGDLEEPGFLLLQYLDEAGIDQGQGPGVLLLLLAGRGLGRHPGDLLAGELPLDGLAAAHAAVELLSARREPAGAVVEERAG